jgi:hypothetical protein
MFFRFYHIVGIQTGIGLGLELGAVQVSVGGTQGGQSQLPDYDQAQIFRLLAKGLLQINK